MRVKPQVEYLYHDTFSTASGCARDGLVATPHLPLQVSRGVQLWTGSTVKALTILVLIRL